MSVKKKTCIFIGLIIVVLFAAVFFKYWDGEEAAVVLKHNNLKEYEEIFGQSLQKYLEETDKNLFVKDITKNKLNHVYRENQLLAKSFYARAGLLTINPEEELAIGMSYRIPTICLNTDSNLLFAKKNREYWIVEDNAVCIQFSFDILNVSGEIEEKAEIVEAGLWLNRNFVTTGFNDSNGHYEIKIWAFKGDKFYPRLRNVSETPYIITNGKISITRDDTIEKNE